MNDQLLRTSTNSNLEETLHFMALNRIGQLPLACENHDDSSKPTTIYSEGTCSQKK